MCKRILVLDDDLAVLSALRDVLEFSGYEVNTFSRGDHIFEDIEKYHPDLILLDIMLADMDGRQICQDIKNDENTGNIPVILISGTHNLGDCMQQQGGPNDFLAKPFDMTSLINKIEHQLTAA